MAGAVLAHDAAAIETSIKNAFARQGYDATVELVQPKVLSARMDAAIASNPDVLLIGGGDGTIRSAAERLAGKQTALAILPLGTVNRMARDLGIPLTVPEALDALAHGHRYTIDAAEVNGRLFLCNSLIGLPPTISEERQKLRGQPFLKRVAGYFSLLRMIAATHRKIELSVNDETGRKRMRVLSIAVSNNPYAETPSLVLTRPRLDQGELGLYISKHNGGLELFWVLLKAAMGRWDDPKLDRLTAKRITISTRRKHLKVSNDGEVDVLDSPLNYSIRAKTLNMLVPAR
jgi:diacylglycerol kinase family enzyme